MRRLLLRLCTIASLLAGLLVLATVSPVSADEGLTIVNNTTYTVDPAGVVRATVDLTLTNVTSDQVNGNTIRRQYFTGFSVPVPVGSTNAVAVSGSGRSLDVAGRLIPGVSEYFLFDVTFARLFAGETQRVTLTFDILGQPPRSEIPTRTNPAYVSFFAFGVGDPGEVAVTVVVPDSWEVDNFGDDVTVTRENGNVVYSATDIENPDDFTVFISARNDAALDSTTSDFDGREYDVRAWPGDAEWRSFVETQLQDGVPALERLIGQPWPIEGSLQVRQANTPYLYGYAGWFSPVNREIEVGEDLDQETVLHELSHAWFNAGQFEDRWVNEGLAEVYSRLAIDDLGGTTESPVTPTTARYPLNEWNDVEVESADAESESEEFGYDTSWYVVDTLVDEIGAEQMSKVIDAAVNDEPAYAGDAEMRASSDAVDWREFLDLAEEIGGSTQAEQLFRDWIVEPAEVDELDARDAARTAFAELESIGGEWTVPRYIRASMGDWQFDDLDAEFQAATAVLAARDELAAVSTELDVSVPGALEAAYESADETLDDTAAAVDAQLDAARAMKSAVDTEAAEPSLLGRVGLIGTDVQPIIDEGLEAVESGDTSAAKAAAQRVERILADADDVGRGRALTTAALAALVLLAIGLLVWWRRRRRRRAATLAEEALAAESDHPSASHAPDSSLLAAAVLFGVASGDDADPNDEGNDTPPPERDGPGEAPNDAPPGSTDLESGSIDTGNFDTGSIDTSSIDTGGFDGGSAGDI